MINFSGTINKLKRLLSCMLPGVFMFTLLLLTFSLYAKHDVVKTIKTGEELVMGARFSLTGNQYTFMQNDPLWKEKFNNYKILNTLRLKFEQSSDVHFNNEFELRVNLQVTYYKYENGKFNTYKKYPSLKITYNQNDDYKDVHAYQFEGGNRMDVQILNVSANGLQNTYLPKVSLESEIDVERYYTFDAETPVNPSAISSMFSPSEGALKVSWPAIYGAEEYDLEWTAVNNYNQVQNSYLSEAETKIDAQLFRVNSTRITTANTTYNIPLLYDHSYIIYRVRGVTKSEESNYTEPLYGVWSQSPSECSNLNVSCFLPNVYEFQGHNDDLNWQAITNYAEEGKNKSAVSYFDGSLRNRQSVSKLNTEEKIIIGETIYDHQGRGAIQVLPVPKDQENIEYVPEFNRNLQENPYGKQDFDKDLNGNCDAVAGAMSSDATGGGAANYYSEKNPDKSEHQAFVPDADGYPFTQVEYTPDNTGRIRRQSGVGPDHQLGSNRETKYFYGKPAQEKVDRLFGSDVGYVMHYKKNLVIDANGQASVSYLDPQGRVIATALAGNAPENLTSLPDNPDKTTTTDLLGKQNSSDATGQYERRSGNQKVLTNELLVSTTGDRDFDYYMKAGTFQEGCEQFPVNVCFNCVLDVSLSVTDECKTQLLDNNLSAKKTIGSIAETCSEAEASEVFTVNMGKVGNYTVSRVMEVNQEALNYYTTSYLNEDVNKCLKKYDLFVSEELDKVDLFGCNINCEVCDEVGRFEDNQWHTENTYNAEVNPDCEPCMTEEEYIDFKAECADMCKEDAIHCENALHMLKTDVSPFGQYGAIMPEAPGVSEEGEIQQPSTDSEIEPHVFPLSIFNDGRKNGDDLGNSMNGVSNVFPRDYYEIEHNISFMPSPNVLPNWRYPYCKLKDENGNPYPQFHYFDENGNIEYVDVVYQGGTDFYPEILPDLALYLVSSFQATNPGQVLQVLPQQLLHVEDFLAKWNHETWALSLVAHHPEYSYYEICVDDQLSNNFDAKWLVADNLQTAYEEGLLPDNNAFPNPLGNGYLTATDPYFNSDLNPKFYTFSYLWMQTALAYYKPYDRAPNGFLNIHQMVHMLVNCPMYEATETSCRDCLAEYDGINTDEEWVQFRQLYYSKKQEIQQYITQLRAIKKTGYNGCIGEEDFNPSRYGFSNMSYTENEGTGWDFYKSYTRSQYWNLLQNCDWFHQRFFVDKAKRFPTNENMTDLAEYDEDVCYEELFSSGDDEAEAEFSNLASGAQMLPVSCPEKDDKIIKAAENKADKVVFETCKQCPLARDVQSFLDALARNGKLLTNGTQLSCYPEGMVEFVPDLERALSLPGNQPVIWDNVSVNGRALSVTIKREGQPEACELKLLIPDNQNASFSQFTGFCCLAYEPNPQYLNTQDVVEKGVFSLNGLIPLLDDNGKETGEFNKIPLEGVTCVNIADCSFEGECEKTPEASAILTYFNTLIIEEDFITSGAEILVKSDAPGIDIIPYEQIIEGYLDGSGSLNSAQWNWTSVVISNQWTGEFKVPGLPNPKCTFEIYKPEANFDFNNILEFTNIRVDTDEVVSQLEDEPANNFIITALIEESGTRRYVEMKGFSSCYAIGVCQPGISSASYSGGN